VTELARALSMCEPCSIAVYPTRSPAYLRWDFSFPSVRRVTVVLSASQSRQMATGLASTSVGVTKRSIGYGTQLAFFGSED
jgi:hypothetical protein